MSEICEQLTTQAGEIARAGHNGWGNTMLAAAEEIARLQRDAERYRFCVERNTMPVIASDGETWCMFLAVKSSRRSLFTGASPSEAIDAAMNSANT
jgi:hypothetical protein